MSVTLPFSLARKAAESKLRLRHQRTIRRPEERRPVFSGVPQIREDDGSRLVSPKATEIEGWLDFVVADPSLDVRSVHIGVYDNPGRKMISEAVVGFKRAGWYSVKWPMAIGLHILRYEINYGLGHIVRSPEINFLVLPSTPNPPNPPRPNNLPILNRGMRRER